MNPAILLDYSSTHITFLASVLIWCMFAALGVFWVIDGNPKKEIVLHTLYAIAFTWIVVGIVKTILPIPRPYHINGMSPLTITPEHLDGSFPSAHTAIAFALAVSVWFHDRKSGIVFIFAALGVGLGRVLSHVHYPIDILGGMIFGSIVAYAVNKIHVFGLLSKKKT